LQVAKKYLVTLALSIATPAELAQSGNPNQLETSELLDTLVLLSALLTCSSLPPASWQFLLSAQPSSQLNSELANLVSVQLRSWALQVARLANPTTNASYLHRQIASLPQHVRTLQAGILNREEQLTAARLAVLTHVAPPSLPSRAIQPPQPPQPVLAHSERPTEPAKLNLPLLSLLQEFSTVLAEHIRVLEAKHSTVSRSVELRAAEQALLAQRGHLEAQSALWAATREVYTPEVRDAMGRYGRHLRDAKTRLGESITYDKGQLREYSTGADGKEAALRQIAKAYQNLGHQIDDAKRDLARLDGA
jgi:hypothetical protein